jgi:acyl-CoA thioesterase
VFGTDRSSRITVAPDVPAPSKPLADAQRFPFVPGLTPQFTQHFEFRLTEGELPFSGSTEATIGGYVRHLTEASGVEALLALIDAWPAPVLSLGRAPFFASTIRWSAQLVAEPPRWPEYFWFRSDCVSARGGYATTVGRLYADDVLVAFSDQLVAVFDAPATSPG